MKLSLAVAFLMSSVVFAAEDTVVEFEHITSLNSGTSVHTVQSAKGSDSVGKFSALGVLVKSTGVVSFEGVKMPSKTAIKPGNHLETTAALSGGSAPANVLSGEWSRPSYVLLGSSIVGSECQWGLGESLGSLPGYVNGGQLTGMQCISNTGACTPNSSFAGEEGAPFSWSTLDGYTWCYRADVYNFYDGTTSYQIAGDQTVTCYTCDI